MIYERIKYEYEILENHIRRIQSELKNLPPGKLICCHQQNTAKWYLGDSHQRTYIPKSNRTLAEQLASRSIRIFYAFRIPFLITS